MTRIPRDTRRSLPIALLRAREAVMARFRPMLATHGLTEQQWRVLRVLDEDGPLDATELADRAYILAPSLTRILKTLEKNGHLTRKRAVEDGRRLIIAPTTQAARLIRRILPESEAIYSEIEAGQGSANIEALLDLLEHLSATDKINSPDHTAS